MVPFHTASRIVRAKFVQLVVLGLASVLFAGAAHAYDQRGPQKWVFDVYRDGKPFGEHRIVIDVDASGRQIVSTNVDYQVKIGPVVAWRYHHVCREIWVSGALSDMACETLKDGKTRKVTAQRGKDGKLVVNGVKGAEKIDGSIGPFANWTVETMSRRMFLSAETGEIQSFAITPLGSEKRTVLGQTVTAQKYQVKGDLTANYWFDPDGNWLGAAFTVRDSKITYALRERKG